MMKFGQRSSSWRETGREDDDDNGDRANDEDDDHDGSFNQSEKNQLFWPGRKTFQACFDRSEINFSCCCANDDVSRV